MRSATVLVLSLTVVGAHLHDGARAQSSVMPPVSLTPPKTSPPHAGTKNSPAVSNRASSTPATIGPAQSTNPATDYDGFSVGSEDNDAPDQAMPPMRSRAVRSGSEQQAIDQEDEALKRKLTICKNCK